MIVQRLLQRSDSRGTLWDFLSMSIQKENQDRSHIIIFILSSCFGIAQNSIKIRPHYTEHNQTHVSEEILFHMNEKVFNCAFQYAYTVLQSFLLRLFLFISGQPGNIFKMERFYGRINVILLLTKKQHRKPGWAMPVLRIVILTGIL